MEIASFNNSKIQNYSLKRSNYRIENKHISFSSQQYWPNEDKDAVKRGCSHSLKVCDRAKDASAIDNLTDTYMKLGPCLPAEFQVLLIHSFKRLPNHKIVITSVINGNTCIYDNYTANTNDKK